MAKRTLAKRYAVKPGSRIRLSKLDTRDTAGYESRESAKKALARNIEKMQELQYLLYAEDKRSLLIVLQAMDCGGKDGTIRHVMGAINPQGCAVTSFKRPSEEELQHDFLWRIHKAVPRRGEIGVFNRSHYEDVLVVRVHDMVPAKVWRRRYDQINAFERHLADNGVAILKFFLHISPEEQRQRLQARVDDSDKNWKINPADFEERKMWGEYEKAYEDALSRCSTPHAPWYVIPADRKWFRNLAVSEVIVTTLKRFRMKFPEPACDVSTLKVE